MQTITIAPPKRSWFSLLSWAIVLAVLVVSWQVAGGAERGPAQAFQHRFLFRRSWMTWTA